MRHHTVVILNGWWCQVEEEQAALDSLSELGTQRPGAEAVLLHPSRIVQDVASKALGRAPSPDITLAAVHALATIAGKFCPASRRLCCIATIRVYHGSCTWLCDPCCSVSMRVWYKSMMLSCLSCLKRLCNLCWYELRLVLVQVRLTRHNVKAPTWACSLQCQVDICWLTAVVLQDPGVASYIAESGLYPMCC